MTTDSVLQRYKPVIGLEVHCQLLTETKLFCGCANRFGALPNHQTCPVCLGMPGVLPVLNQRAVDFALKLALAVGARINEVSVFARKQYFYPDLPKGYQITQFDLPYCVGGGLRISGGKFVELTRIHIEEDAGKNIHGDDASFVDCNRAGVPLLEIVTKPSIETPGEAVDYLRRLRSLVRHLGISDGNMEEGSFRCDANVSIRPVNETKMGTRCEIKNLNSFNNIERAIRYEILRQADILDSGEMVKQQTMLFDTASGKTSPMRSKEESHDYRYFSDPDLGPLIIHNTRIETLRAVLPELPEAMVSRFKTEYGLPDGDALTITADRELAFFYEDVVRLVKEKVSPKIVANWLISEYLCLSEPSISADDFASLLRLIGEGTISGKIAKVVFEEMVQTGARPKDIVKSRNLLQISDPDLIQKAVCKVLDAHPQQLAQFLEGKEKVFGFFVGQIMRENEGKLNPGMLNEILRQELSARKSN